MGEVYLARDRKLDWTVAIKILPEAFSTDPTRLLCPQMGGGALQRHAPLGVPASVSTTVNRKGEQHITGTSAQDAPIP
jgi:hypothetical protein